VVRLAHDADGTARYFHLREEQPLPADPALGEALWQQALELTGVAR